MYSLHYRNQNHSPNSTPSNHRTLQNSPMKISHSSVEILFSCCHFPTQISLLTKCDLFTLHPPNSLRQHHQGEHRRCGGGGEKSGAEDRELHSAGRGTSHREGGHAFLCSHQTLTHTHTELNAQEDKYTYFTYVNKDTKMLILPESTYNMNAIRQCFIHDS